jgi:putative ABC transport system permease protein
VGTSGQARFKGVELNDRVTLADGDWTVVGTFVSGDDIIQGELLADADTVMSSVRRNGYGSVIVRLASPAAFDGFKKAVESNPALNAQAERHVDYYRRTSGGMAGFFSFFAYFVGAIMAIGALRCRKHNVRRSRRTHARDRNLARHWLRRRADRNCRAH